MIHLKILFTCQMCGNNKNFYAIPIDKKAGNSYIHSLKEFKLQCKDCGKDYLLNYNIKGL